MFKARIKIAAAIPLIFMLSACSTTRPQNDEERANRSPEEISELYTDLATSALMNEDLPRAIENLRIALKYNSDNATAHNNLGLAYVGMGKRDEARAEYERAISINPKYSDANVNLGTWHFGKNDFTTARHYYKRALENLEYRSRFLPLTSLGHIELVQGNREEARKFLYEALADNPEYCLAHMLLGHLYDKESRFDKARDEYKQSIRGVCVKNSEGQYKLGMAYLKLKNYKGARSQFTQIMDSFPSSAMAELAGERIKEIP